jgi:lysozyme family protein
LPAVLSGAKVNFIDAINRVLSNEGGLVDNPADPGGLTNWGWSLAENPDLTADQIRSMTRDQAAARYKVNFWDVIGADSLPFEQAFQILDFAVNAGLGTAIRKAQEALGVADDGRWGPVSAAAIAKLPAAVFILRFAAFKIRYYTKLSTFGTFGAGWMNRVAQDLEYAGSDPLS